MQSQYPWVKIDPSDTGFPDFIRTPPSIFVPRICKYYKFCVRWGIPDEDEDEDGSTGAPRILMRQMQTQFTYMGIGGPPEVNF